MLVPLFPLNVVLFPSAALPLHVFEERYQAMMTDLLEGAERQHPSIGPSFAVTLIREGLEVGGRAETYAIGCMAEIERVRTYPDGRLDLLTRGTRRMRIVNRPADDPYPRADVTLLEEHAGPRAGEALDLARAAFERYREVISIRSGEGANVTELPSEPVAASYAIAHAIRIEATRLQALLETPTAAERLALAASFARREAALLEAIGPPAGRPVLDTTSLN